MKLCRVMEGACKMRWACPANHAGSEKPPPHDLTRPTRMLCCLRAIRPPLRVGDRALIGRGLSSRHAAQRAALLHLGSPMPPFLRRSHKTAPSQLQSPWKACREQSRPGQQPMQHPRCSKDIAIACMHGRSGAPLMHYKCSSCLRASGASVRWSLYTALGDHASRARLMQLPQDRRSCHSGSSRSCSSRAHLMQAPPSSSSSSLQ